MAEPKIVLTEMDSKTGKEEKQITDIDDILKYTGEFGKYQIIIGTLIALPVWCVGYPILIMTFAAINPPWQCVANSTVCKLNGTYSSADTDNYLKRCDMPRSAWEFTQPKEYSIVTQFDIYCDTDYFIYLSSTIFFVGWGVGSIFLGWLTDSYGRRRVLFGAVATVLLFFFLSAFSPNIEVFCTFRFLIGLFYPATMVNPSVLLGEMVGPRHRPMFGSFTAVAFTLSLVITGLKAYYIREWKTLIMICSAPYSLVMLCYFFVPESIRWLRIRGEHARLIELLKKMAKMNGKELPADLELAPLSDTEVIKTRSNVLDLFRPAKMFLLTISQGYIWMSVAGVYYGISLGVGQLTGELYRDFVLSSAIEMPSIAAAIILMQRPGRKPTMVLMLVLSGVFCGTVGGLINDDDLKTWRLLLGLSGKFCISIAFNTVYTWSFELYPTSARGAGMSFMQISARVGSAMAPWLAKWLGVFHIAIPFSLMGALSLVAGIICLALPETRDSHTPETMNQVVGMKKPMAALIAVNEHAKV